MGEGFRPWDARPGSTMTNGDVEEMVDKLDGEVLTVKYKGGEQKIVVTPDAVILAYAVGDKSELKPGAHVAIVRAVKSRTARHRVNVGLRGKQADGSLLAKFTYVGRGASCR